MMVIGVGLAGVFPEGELAMESAVVVVIMPSPVLKSSMPVAIGTVKALNDGGLGSGGAPGPLSTGTPLTVGALPRATDVDTCALPEASAAWAAFWMTAGGTPGELC